MRVEKEVELSRKMLDFVCLLRARQVIPAGGESLKRVSMAIKQGFAW